MKQLRIVLIAAALFLALALRALAQSDPLPSWNDTAPKRAIMTFVADTTEQGSPSFIPQAERVATFDNDGTLWAEQPIYFQIAFALDEVKRLAPQHPEWKDQEPFKSALAGDMKGVMASGENGFMQLLAATHAGMSTDVFSASVSKWAATAKHPKTGKLYTEMVYQPMVELLEYLRANGFKTYIVSGGGQEFMRAWVEKTYGIPPEQVVGSQGDLKFEIRDGKPVLLKEAKVTLVDDGPAKPVGIQRFIGRRPVLAFGNSDGDQQMLEWTWAGSRKRFCGIVHHTDAEREWAYDRTSHIGKLDKAWDEGTANGWVIVDMKKDWKRVFAFEP